MHHPADRIIHTTAFVEPVMGALVVMEKSSMLGPSRLDSVTVITQVRALTTELNTTLPVFEDKHLYLNTKTKHEMVYSTLLLDPPMSEDVPLN